MNHSEKWSIFEHLFYFKQLNQFNLYQFDLSVVQASVIKSVVW